MSDEIIRTSWLSRLGNSVKGILFGFLLFIGSFFLLSWNENNAVNQYRNLNEIQKTTTSIAADVVTPALDNMTVHLTGEASTPATLTDPEFGVEVNAIRLNRFVETFVWRESEESRTEKKVGGSTEKHIHYTYQTAWSSSIPQNSFNGPKAADYPNPTQQAFEDWSKSADIVNVGAFRLAKSLVSSIRFTEPVRPTGAKVPDGAVVQERYIFIGNDAAKPAVGDTRIHFTQTPQEMISLIAGQKGSDLAEATLSNGKSFQKIMRGAHSLDAMVAKAKSEVNLLTWILRGVGFFLMGFGLNLVFRPLSVVADVVPFIGNLVGAGIGFISFTVAAILSCVTIAIAWIAVRPLIAVPLLVTAALLIGWIWKRKRAANAALQSASQDKE